MAEERLSTNKTFIEKLLERGLSIPEARLVAVLMENPGELLSEEYLMEEVYKDTPERKHRPVSKLIHSVRWKLGEKSIETKRISGYTLGHLEEWT